MKQLLDRRMFAEEVEHHRLDRGLERSVRKARPSAARRGVEWRVEWLAQAVGEDDARFLCDEEAGEIVGVATQAGRLFIDLIEDGSEVAVEAVMADDEFVHLPAGADVLVVKDHGLGDVCGADGGVSDVLHQLTGQGFGAGKEV